MDLYETLRGDILDGRLPSGTLLLQTDLARRFAVSRIPVRDALQRLAAARLVTVEPNRGARVIALTEAELAEIWDMRALLEADLARRATGLAGPADHDEVEHALRRAELEAGRPGWRAGDLLFHETLHAAAGRPRQTALVRELRETCAVHVADYDALIAETPRWLADHRAIFAAFRAGDAETAARLVSTHVSEAGAHLLARRGSPSGAASNRVLDHGEEGL